MSWLDPLPKQHNQGRSLILRTIADSLVAGSATSNHSAQGWTLGYMIRHLEDAQVPYTLEAIPGVGYSVTSHPERREA